jgi:hypothetical protein
MSNLSNSAGQVVTANDLLTGDVIYAIAGCQWSRNINDAQIFNDEKAVNCTLDQAQQQTLEIVEPYSVPVERDVYGNVVPLHYREQIRVNGPNVDLRDASSESGYVVMGC